MSNLAILICTLPERADKLKRLTNILLPQINRYLGFVSVHFHDAGVGMPTGTKRNQLIQQTDSNYFCFIDDDDIVTSYYVDEIMKAIALNPDVVTFCGYMTTNGTNKKDFTIKLGSAYEERDGHYYRFPNHLSVMRRAAVSDVFFDPIWVLEDYNWAKKIHDRKLLKTEVHIPIQLYHYDCHPKVNKYQRVRQ